MSEIKLLETIEIDKWHYNVLQKMVEMKPKGKYYQFNTFAGYIPAEPLYKLIVRLKRQQGPYGSSKIAITRLDSDTLQFVATVNDGQDVITEVVNCNDDMLLDDSLIRGEAAFQRELARENGLLEEEDKPLEPTVVWLNQASSQYAYGGYRDASVFLELVKDVKDKELIQVEIDGRTFWLATRPLKAILRLFGQSNAKGGWSMFVGSEVVEVGGKEQNRLTCGFNECTQKYTLMSGIRHTCYFVELDTEHWRNRKETGLHLVFKVYGRDLGTPHA